MQSMDLDISYLINYFIINSIEKTQDCAHNALINNY